jgi:hypothetical protein
MTRRLNPPAPRGQTIVAAARTAPIPRKHSRSTSGINQTKCRVIKYRQPSELTTLELAGGQTAPSREHQHVKRAEPVRFFGSSPRFLGDGVHGGTIRGYVSNTSPHLAEKFTEKNQEWGQ